MRPPVLCPTRAAHPSNRPVVGVAKLLVGVEDAMHPTHPDTNSVVFCISKARREPGQPQNVGDMFVN